MGISFSSSCVFIFYIVFSFSFCLLQTFVIRGNYLIEKKKMKYILQFSSQDRFWFDVTCAFQVRVVQYVWEVQHLF